MRRAAALALLLAAAPLGAPALAEPASYYAPHQLTHALLEVDGLEDAKHKGSFNLANAKLHFDVGAEEISQLQFALQVESLMMEDAGQLEAMTSSDELSAGNYPEITFIQNKNAKFTDKKADIEGDLTVKGATHPVTVKATLKRIGKDSAKHDTVSLAFAFPIKRVDYGVGDPLKGKRYGEDIQIKLDLQALKN